MFEKNFQKYFGFGDVYAVNSGTSAIQLALLVLNIGQGDEVITSNGTCVSVLNCIENSGANTVLIDIEKDTFNIDHTKIEQAITSKTKALLIPHYAGHPSEMQRITEIAKQFNLYLIEDVARAQGAEYKGKKCGCFGDLSIFSFSVTKGMTAIDGGMLVGKQLLINKAKEFSYQHLNESVDKTYKLEYKMNDVAASLAIEQLKRFSVFIKNRAKVAQYYNDKLVHIPGLVLPKVKTYVKTCWHQYTILVDEYKFGFNARELINSLIRKKIEISPDYILNHSLSYYKHKYNYKNFDFPIANYISKNMVCLPIFPDMSFEQYSYVVKSIEDCYKGKQNI